jgi:BirA family biotin operon repressor/biotin-[acetyl-CoA-carboxylase] ligase
LWITAECQSAGRGRRGNEWVSPPGNLYATLLLTEPSPPRAAPQLSFVAALALHDAISAAAPSLASRLALKWPNDLLLAGGKLAGILIEGEPTPVFAVAVGLGVNCVSHPDGTTHPATNLAAAGVSASAAQVFAALVVAMNARLVQWREGEGFHEVRADWLARAAGLGEPMRVRLPERELTGRFQGLDEDGRLLLATDGGIVTIAAGDVFPMPFLNKKES